ncbi:MAG TPA: L,D-transpeptidase family protein [Methyloceanibacter sp.]|jgi:murein L,D-transpeptidase YcbB/YkuD|nr:L,D-transpeptidase family protein [Methyloceanibacter sp.]
MRGGAFLAAAGFAAALLIISFEPASAGLFSWMKGPQGNQGGDSGSSGGPGLFGGNGGGLFGGGQRGPQQPGSQAFHGDELPPEEGNAATQAWIVNPELGWPTLSAANIPPTKAAIVQYQSIVAQGGWPTVGSDVVVLHRRLEISGDLVGRSIPDEYDAALTEAVKKFQRRHALPPTGAMDAVTIKAMNVPAVVRLGQLQAGLKQLQHLAPTAPARYVVVNIPAAQVEAVESGQVAQRHAAVVGKPARPSPELTSKIQEINFNPYWYVPKSIIYKDLVPKAREFTRRGQDFLSAYHMQAFDAAGNPIDSRQIDWNGTEVYNYQFRQLPWSENSLGYIKINFPNKDAVYMHDTPLKSLFGRAERFDSSGCVRVHNVDTLAAWILRDTPGWDINRIQAMKQTGEQIDAKLSKPLPVYFTYISAWGLPDGSVQFRPDIYNQDGGDTTASAY